MEYEDGETTSWALVLPLDLPRLPPSASLRALLYLFTCLPVHLTLGITEPSLSMTAASAPSVDFTLKLSQALMRTAAEAPLSGLRWHEVLTGEKCDAHGEKVQDEREREQQGSRQLSRLWRGIWPSSLLAGVLQMSYILHCCGNNHTQLPFLYTLPGKGLMLKNVSEKRAVTLESIKNHWIEGNIEVNWALYTVQPGTRNVQFFLLPGVLFIHHNLEISAFFPV